MTRKPGVDLTAAALDSLADADRSALYERLRESGATTTAVDATGTAGLESEAQQCGLALATLGDHASLRAAILHQRARREGIFWASGLCDLEPDGFGFLRAEAADFAAGPGDVYVSGNQLLHLGLRTGHFVEGPARPPRNGERHAALLRVETVGGRPLAEHLRTVPFEARLAVVPHTALDLAAPSAPLAVRALARLLPLAHGQRVLVTIEDRTLPRVPLLGAIAGAAAARDGRLLVQACLLDAAAEDRSSFRAAVPTSAVAVATFDASPTRQLEVAELALARAQRAAEAGHRVLLVLDSLSAVLRHGRDTLPRGDHRLHDGAQPAVQRVKRAFSLARQLEGHGSLTVLTTLRAAGDRTLDDDLAAMLLCRASAVATFADDGSGLPDPTRTAVAPVELALDAAGANALARLRSRLAEVPAGQRVDRWPGILEDA